MRVVGRTAAGLSAASAAYNITRPRPPDFTGHQRDHTTEYDLSELPTGDDDHAVLGGRLRNAAPGAAADWAEKSPYLSAAPGSEVAIRVYVPSATDKGCDRVSEVACVNTGRNKGVEIELRSQTMYFYPSPVYKGVVYTWTKIEGLHNKDAPGGGKYLWVTAALRHEFGHTFGLKHPPDSSYTGIMNADRVYGGLKEIQDVDIDELRPVYHGHIRDQGW